MKGLLGKVAALVALGVSYVMPGYSVPQSLELPLPDFARNFIARRRSRSSTKPSRYELENRRRRNAAALDRARAKTAALRGDPPGYTYAHRDRLVRMVGARGANMLEDRVLARTISYRRALEIAQVAA